MDAAFVAQSARPKPFSLTGTRMTRSFARWKPCWKESSKIWKRECGSRSNISLIGKISTPNLGTLDNIVILDISKMRGMYEQRF